MSFELVSLDVILELAHHYGYAAVFLGILVENMGIPVPGETITVVGGFLAGNEELSYWGVLGSATIGAVLGDSIGYWIGAYGGWPLVIRFGNLFNIEETRLEEVRQQFLQNAPKAVFFGRFIALFRIFAGPLAGIAQMPYRKFLIYNIAGACVWAGATVTATYFIGRILPLEQLISLMAKLGLAAVLVIAAAIALPLLLERRAHLLKQAESKE
jgi:membrane protein DedA with SNARE-associated domain